MTATLRQAKKVLEIFEDVPSEQLQALLASGLLADLRDGNITDVKRDEFRLTLGLKALVSVVTVRIDPAKTFVRDMTKEGWELVEDVPQSLSAASSLEFVSFLKRGESYTSGTEMRKRAKAMGANFGQHDVEWLLENQHLIPAREQDHCLVFPGTLWHASDGSLGVPCLDWDGERWFLSFYLLENDWFSFDRLVRPRK